MVSFFGCDSAGGAARLSVSFACGCLSGVEAADVSVSREAVDSEGMPSLVSLLDADDASAETMLFGEIFSGGFTCSPHPASPVIRSPHKTAVITFFFIHDHRPLPQAYRENLKSPDISARFQKKLHTRRHALRFAFFCGFILLPLRLNCLLIGVYNLFIQLGSCFGG